MVLENYFYFRESYISNDKLILEARNSRGNTFTIGSCSNNIAGVLELCKHGERVYDIYFETFRECRDDESKWLEAIGKWLDRMYDIAEGLRFDDSKASAREEIRKYKDKLGDWCINSEMYLDEHTIQDMFLMLPWCICELSGVWD